MSLVLIMLPADPVIASFPKTVAQKSHAMFHFFAVKTVDRIEKNALLRYANNQVPPIDVILESNSYS